MEHRRLLLGWAGMPGTGMYWTWPQSGRICGRVGECSHCRVKCAVLGVRGPRNSESKVKPEERSPALLRPPRRQFCSIIDTFLSGLPGCHGCHCCCSSTRASLRLVQRPCTSSLRQVKYKLSTTILKPGLPSAKTSAL